MDPSTLEAEQASIEEDILKLQLHSVTLNLSLDDNHQQQEEEDDDDEDEEESYLLTPFEDPDRPSTSGLNVGASTSGLGNSNSGQHGPPSQPAIDSEDDEEVSPQVGEEEGELIDLSVDLEANPRNILKLNIAYQEVIQQQLHLVEELIEQNKMKQDELNSEMEDTYYSDPNKSRPKADLGLCLSPFFKHNTFCHGGNMVLSVDIPPHPDVDRRYHELGEHFLENPMPSRKWNKLEEKKLTEGVRRIALRQVLKPLMSRLEYLEEKNERIDEPDPELQSKITQVRSQIDSTKATDSNVLVGDRDRTHDWMAISNIDFEGQRTPAECELYWRNSLHPSVNKKVWTAEEDANLRQIIRKSREKNWKVIADELGTGRTPMQCIQRYQQSNTDHKARPWTPEEDEQLKQLVKKHRAGTAIPYTLIAMEMGNRSSFQVCHRWNKSIDPAFKRTKWLPEEDIQLLRAIIKYGLRWSVIRDSGMVPGRNDAQCRERWDNTLRGVNRDPWKKEEDKIIRELIEKHGAGQWSKIALALDRRTDNQVLNRWKYLKRCKEQGVKVQYKKKGPKTIIDGLAEVRQKLIDTIEKQMAEKKQGLLPSKLPSSRKKAVCAAEVTPSSQPKEKQSEEPVGGLSSSQVIRIPSALESNRKLKWIGTDLQERLKKAKDPEEMIEIYKDICEKVADFHAPKDSTFWVRSDRILNEKILKMVSERYRPLKWLAEQQGTNIHQIQQKVLQSLKVITPKIMFVHYIKAMNINAEKTLQAIQRNESKTPAPAAQGTQKQSLSKSQTSQPESETSNPQPTTVSSTPFTRTHMLQLCAPNRAMLSAYRKLMNDRDRRVKNAKLMLLEKGEKKTRKRPKQANIKPGGSSEANNVIGSSGTYNGEKFHAENLMKNIQMMQEHRMLRARFVSLFAWPTVLSSLVPYERVGQFGMLKPAVLIRRKPAKNGEEENSDDEPVPKKKRRVPAT